MTKYVIMEGEFPYAIVDTPADAEEFILSLVEEWAYENYLFEVLRCRTTTEEYFADTRELMKDFHYLTQLGFLCSDYEIYAVKVPVI